MEPSDDLELARHEMLTKQLRQRGITDRRVLDAMGRVPRERFVWPDMQAYAYSDRALGIDCGQTISQPYIVGLMTQALRLTGSEAVLEIGTGSGYQAAVLAELARWVVSVERHPELSATARERLDELGYRNVTLMVGDGSLGWPEFAPYDRIIVTAAAPECPPALFEQLAEAGILVIPLGTGDGQTLAAIRKHQGRAQTMHLAGCRFVPLVGVQAWPDSTDAAEEE